jgi:DNA-binding CsgD family transcriptional regulator
MTELNKLSDRERDVVNLLLEGKSNKLIASSLGISESTVEFHLKNIYAKFQVNSRTELILKLGKTTGEAEPKKLGQSIVDKTGESTENKERLNSRMNWAKSFRDTVLFIGKELKMDNVMNSKARSEVNPMTFFESIRVCLTKYAEFNGRASRPEFWWFALFITLIAGALTYLSENVSSIFLIAMLLPLMAAGARRLHDSGRSGWWQLFLLVPVAGIVLLGFLWALPPTSALPDDKLPS